jgi:DNA-directed RNA polymerase specialized sigma24 family protein
MHSPDWSSRTGATSSHCYRMLGSVHDAEDALQDALVGAWRGLPGFEGARSASSASPLW